VSLNFDTGADMSPGHFGTCTEVFVHMGTSAIVLKMAQVLKCAMTEVSGNQPKAMLNLTFNEASCLQVNQFMK